MIRGVLASLMISIALLLGAMACGQDTSEGAQTAEVSLAGGELTSSEAAELTASEDALAAACTPPRVLCPCFDDGIERCVGLGLCNKCCAGEIPSCEGTNP